MAIVYIPANDYSTRASVAQTITSLDLGFIQAGESKSAAFKVGNSGPAGQFLSLESTSSSPVGPVVSLSETAFTLGPDQISDTVTLAISLPLEVPSQGYVVEITAMGLQTSLAAYFQAVGVNAPRRSQYPERADQTTDSFQGVIDRLGEPLLLHRFDPIPYDPADTRVTLDLEGHFHSQYQPCDRLDPLNDEWGYSHASEIIIANVQGEEESIRLDFQATDTAMTYSGSLRVTIPAEYELDRQWALFNPASGPDLAQYKRTVWIFERQGTLYAMVHVHPAYQGNVITHYECTAVQIHDRGMGSADFYNPFALTFAKDSDKPYAAFTCPLTLAFVESVTGGSDSSS